MWKFSRVMTTLRGDLAVPATETIEDAGAATAPMLHLLLPPGCYLLSYAAGKTVAGMVCVGVSCLALCVEYAYDQVPLKAAVLVILLVVV